MEGVITAPQEGVSVELEELPGGMAIMAMERNGELLVLIDPKHTPERLRDDLSSVLSHLIRDGLLRPAWNGGTTVP